MIESPMRKARSEGRRGICGEMEQLEPKAGTRPSAGCFEHTKYRDADMDTHSRICPAMSGGNLRYRRLKQPLSFHSAGQWDRAPVRLALWMPCSEFPGLMSPVSC